MSLKCPECKASKSVKFCRDVIEVSDINTKTLKLGSVFNTNPLDNCWLECLECSQTSEDSDKLKKMFDKI